MSNYIVDGSDLTSVANAIRAKSGGSSQLTFPAGFVSEIGNIPSGGGGYSLADVVRADGINGTIDMTGLTPTNYALANRTGITKVVGKFPWAQNVFQGCTGITECNVEITGSASATNLFLSCTNLQTAVVKSQVGNSALFSGCSKLKTADLTLPQLRLNGFRLNALLDTIILRQSSAIVTLEHIAVFAMVSHFESGGSGGTIYIPKALYDHLGDGGSLDYKAATNWSTVNGYGTITWAKIEGSIYETQYADGTTIPTA